MEWASKAKQGGFSFVTLGGMNNQGDRPVPTPVIRLVCLWDSLVCSAREGRQGDLAGG